MLKVPVSLYCVYGNNAVPLIYIYVTVFEKMGQLTEK